MEPLPFGNERLDVIAPEKMNILREKYTDAYQFIYSVLKEIYFNKEAPYNNNVRYVIGNKRIMQVWTGSQWTEFPEEQVMHDMFITFEKVNALHEAQTEETLQSIRAKVKLVKY